MHARIKIGVATYNDRGFLPLLLESIRLYTVIDEPYDLVVCDDGSTASLKEETRAVCEKFGAVLIEHPHNAGIPTTWNHLVYSLDHAAEIIVLLNNDLLVPPDWLKVAVHFLDANKDNPHVGSMFWNPVNQVPMEAMRGFLHTLEHTSYVTTDSLTGKPRDFTATSPMSSRQGEGQGLGRVMCPCGCCFAFRKEVFDQIGPFNEEYISFHEESDWGTRCAAAGRASFGFAYPRPYHGVGQTFAANPELSAHHRMQMTRRMYRQRWNVPEEVPTSSYFDWVNRQLMPQIPLTRLKFLSPDYTQAPDVRQREHGHAFNVPMLVEREGEF